MSDLTASDLKAEIDAGWMRRETLGATTGGAIAAAVEEVLRRLDAGALRVAEKIDGQWTTHQWLKEAILLSFRLWPNTVLRAGALGGQIGPWWDKVPGKFDGWEAPQFEAAGFRAVPGAVVRRGAYIAPDVVLMPSFVNVGAWVGEGTMVDTWATVGSCAQIGKGVHISGGAGIPAGCWNRCRRAADHRRGRLLHRRPLGGGRGGGRRRGRGALHGRLHHRHHPNRRSQDRRDPSRPRAALCCGGAGVAA